MSLTDILPVAVHHMITHSESDEKKTEAEIVDEVNGRLLSKDVHFSNYCTLILKKDNKKRYIKRYENPLSAESVLCQCVKYILDRAFRVR